MILSCNSCEKKFVVPDSAISSTGRLVQCSSCGNKWKQFPTNVKQTLPKAQSKPISAAKTTHKNIVKKTKKKKTKKRIGPDLYSPEYLAKKHGIKIQSIPSTKEKNPIEKSKIKFGFYNYLIVWTVTIIFLIKILNFAQSPIIEFYPPSEIYLNYLFESIKNISEIIMDFLSGY